MSADQQEIAIKFRHNAVEVETMYAIKVAEDKYRVQGQLLGDVRITYGTIVEARPDEKGELWFYRIDRLSDFITETYLLPEQAIGKRDELRKIGEKVTAIGGAWEIVMGGMVFMYLPKDSNFDVEAEIRMFFNSLSDDNG